jgi:CheY-like chemotaxis protein
MPHGGAITVTTELTELDEEFRNVHGYGEPGRYALITFSDNGTGMDEAVRQRIFEPFFTSKEQGKGTGLGLSILYGIIKQHNGIINVYSEPDMGTTFRIYLPLIPGEAEKKEIDSTTVPEGGTETILIADDDPMIRGLTMELLSRSGYTIILAEDGEAALNLFQREREHISLVILDVIMPKMNGKEVFDEIRKNSPGCRVIFMSGYTADIVNKRGLMEDGFNFVSKPLRPEMLLRKVREVLDLGVNC